MTTKSTCSTTRCKWEIQYLQAPTEYSRTMRNFRFNQTSTTMGKNYFAKSQRTHHFAKKRKTKLWILAYMKPYHSFALIYTIKLPYSLNIRLIQLFHKHEISLYILFSIRINNNLINHGKYKIFLEN